MIVETAGITAAKLIATGFLLGIGFYASKKLTNKIDEVLFRYDKRKMERLRKEMSLTNDY